MISMIMTNLALLDQQIQKLKNYNLISFKSKLTDKLRIVCYLTLKGPRITKIKLRKKITLELTQLPL